MSIDHTEKCPGKWTVIENVLTNKNAMGYVVCCRGECKDLNTSTETKSRSMHTSQPSAISKI